MIRGDALWLSVAPLDMRAGMDTILVQVVQVFGEARPHHAYLFANRRGTRMKEPSRAAQQQFRSVGVIQRLHTRRQVVEPFALLGGTEKNHWAELAQAREIVVDTPAPHAIWPLSYQIQACVNCIDVAHIGCRVQHGELPAGEPFVKERTPLAGRSCW